MNKVYKKCILILVGILFWLLYICQKEMSNYGIYTIFSYRFHEIASLIPFVGFGVTSCWIIYYFFKKEYKKEKLFILFLFCLIIVQGCYIYRMTLKKTNTVVAAIEKIDRAQGKIIAVRQDNECKITLESPMLVNNLLGTKYDEQLYLINYEYCVNNPSNGCLYMIKLVQ